MDSDDMLLLKADGFMSYGTACEFVQVLTAKDGSKVVTGLCQFEGEDGSARRTSSSARAGRTRSAHHLQLQRRSLRRSQSLSYDGVFPRLRDDDRASSSGSSTTLSCSLGSVRAMTAEAGLSLQIGRQMRHAGRDVEEVAGLDEDMVLELVAVPGIDLAGEHVDRGLMAFMHMRLGAAAGRQRQKMHADACEPTVSAAMPAK